MNKAQLLGIGKIAIIALGVVLAYDAYKSYSSKAATSAPAKTA